MRVYSEQTEKKINELLERAFDAENGFRKAAENVNDTHLQAFFTNKAKERKKWRSEIRNDLHKNGLAIREADGSWKGDMHRLWMDTKALFSANSEEAMLEEVQKGEKAALDDYNEIITNHSLPTSTEKLLKHQKEQIEQSYNKANVLESVH